VGRVWNVNEADDGVRTQRCGKPRPFLQCERGLLIENHDGPILLRLVEQFGCVERALASTAAAIAVDVDSHAV
jgi:hypothetical protein